LIGVDETGIRRRARAVKEHLLREHRTASDSLIVFPTVSVLEKHLGVFSGSNVGQHMVVGDDARLPIPLEEKPRAWALWPLVWRRTFNLKAKVESGLS
jgi:hypothetical protein